MYKSRMRSTTMLMAVAALAFSVSATAAGVSSSPEFVHPTKTAPAPDMTFASSQDLTIASVPANTPSFVYKAAFVGRPFKPGVRIEPPRSVEPRPSEMSVAMTE